MNVNENESPGAKTGESQMASVLDVVCLRIPVLVQVTVSPGFTVISGGMNAKSTMLTFAVSARAEGPVGGRSASGLTTSTQTRIRTHLD